MEESLEQIQKPLVSIITPAFNSAKFINETIESVLKQTYTNWELIIVDDDSSDRTVEQVKEFQRWDSRIMLIELKENRGSAVARNIAMKNAKGRYIAFLDSDDLWLPMKLEKQLKFMQKNDIAFSFTKYIRIYEDGSETKAISRAPKKVNYDFLMKHCVIGCLTVMLDIQKIGSVEMTNIRTRQDYALWLKLTRQGYIAYGLPEILSKYRLVKGSISSNKWKAAKQNWYVYRRIEKQNLFKSIWYFCNYAYTGIKSVNKRKVEKEYESKWLPQKQVTKL
ncbi:glycosyltransferase family 2 protein [Oceanobacillus sp. J11TS1]|uniref:glycosyltransferase family 2 protein n=1 Tax=Oceanobacillus sp. J11TS1 TaxID=2807191 RepID=UPI001B280801|nr:glycosyltransferase family 2 protein [Oceanobacillus sp. J11TS1]GIO23425.1 putative teichuronic acid biosynthesis glycosyltransferase TuaG [Oceanobacillus sp. J11TS1]